MQNNARDLLTVESSSAVTEIRIKGSRFIGQVFHIESTEEFEYFYRQAKRIYMKATHYCYAYRISSDLYHFSDDGEPGGTAGKPLLFILSEKNLYQILLIVIRYFGGVKLGRSGLVRAYSQSAQETLQQAKIVSKIVLAAFSLRIPYLLVQDIQYLLKKYDGKITKTDYAEQVKIYAQIPAPRYSDFKDDLHILTKKGQLNVELVENSPT